MKYEKFSANQNIITHGEKGDKYYIVFTGQVLVIIPTHITMHFTFQQLFDFVSQNISAIECFSLTSQNADILSECINLTRANYEEAKEKYYSP